MKKALIIVCGLVVLVVGGYFVFEELAFQGVKRRGFDNEYAVNPFIKQFPNSRHIADIDDGLWAIVVDKPALKTWREYRSLMPQGRHLADLDRLIAQRKEALLKKMSTDPNGETACEFWFDFPDDDKDIATVREQLLTSFESKSKPGPNAPPAALFHKFVNAFAPNPIPYSLRGFKEVADKELKDVVASQLKAAFASVHMDVKEVSESEKPPIRIGGASEEVKNATYQVTDEKSGSTHQSTDHPRIAAIQVQLFYPDKDKASWQYVGASATPEKFSTQGGVDVNSATADRMRGQIADLFEYYKYSPYKYW